MTRTGYAALKSHFDKLFVGGYSGNGLEQIRDVYSYAFGTKVHLYDIFQTPLRVYNNAVNKIVTLIGPENDDLKTGIIPCLDSLDCVSIFSNEYLKGLTKENIDQYVIEVYTSMNNVMVADHLFNVSDSIARDNPYCAFLKCCPFYFTYHHIKYVAPDLVYQCKAFESILEKYICDSEDVHKVLESISTSKYNPEFEDIYAIMTCSGTVDILL